MANLLIRKGSNPGRRHLLDQESILLGREGSVCQIIMRSPSVSRRHARIVREGKQFFIEDLNSRNKTYVNNKKILERTLLKDKDEIRICDYVFCFEVDDPADSMSSVYEPPETPYAVEASADRAAAADPRPELLEMSRLACRLALVPDELLPKALDLILRIWPRADRGMVILRPPGNGKLDVAVVRGPRPGPEPDYHPRIVTDCLRTGRGVLCQESRSGVTRSVLCVPMGGGEGGRVAGVFWLDAAGPSRFGPADLNRLSSLAGPVGDAL